MRIRSKYAVVAAMVALAAAAVPVLAATASRPGSIALTSPADGSALHDTARIAWSYSAGTAVKTASKVGVYRSSDRANWTLIAGGLPISARSYQLNTKNLADGPYFLRLIADGKVGSGINRVIMDNTAPVVSITKPSNGSLIIEDSTVVAPPAVVIGRSTLQVAAEDRASGIASVVWSLNNTEIARGMTTSYDFGANPGRHTLTATVKDRAGNEASSSVDVVALPGQGQAGPTPNPTPPAVPTDVPTALPTTLPTTLPTLPGLPTPPTTPPTTPPSPPSPPAPPSLPTPVPTPTI